MLTMADFVKVSPCEYSEGLGREQFVDGAIRELWPVSYTHLTLPTTPYV